MTKLEALLNSISDTSLRDKLVEAYNAETTMNSYGLIFKRHIPETYTITDGKRKRVIRRDEVIYPSLRKNAESIYDLSKPLHWLIESNNLFALKLLQYTHLGKVDFQYIDPPYNTGKQGSFKYNDKMVDDQDLFKHSLWLSFMENRLLLSKKLMSDMGVIFVSIDENEYAPLKLLMDQIFPNMYVGTFCWVNRTSANDSGNGLSINHEYILCYSKSAFKFIGIPKKLENYKNPDSDPNGLWASENPTAPTPSDAYMYPIKNPLTGQVDIPPKGRSWCWPRSTFDAMLKEHGSLHTRPTGIMWKSTVKKGERGFIYKRYRDRLRNTENQPISSIISETPDGKKLLTQLGTKTYRHDLGLDDSKFKYPKPVELVKFLLAQYPKKDATVLDWFAGSGTTFQAVAELNRDECSNYRCILVTLGEEALPNGTVNHIARDVTWERMRRVTAGTDAYPACPANIKYVTLQLLSHEEAQKSNSIDEILEVLNLQAGNTSDWNKSIKSYWFSPTALILLEPLHIDYASVVRKHKPKLLYVVSNDSDLCRSISEETRIPVIQLLKDYLQSFKIQA